MPRSYLVLVSLSPHHLMSWICERCANQKPMSSHLPEAGGKITLGSAPSTEGNTMPLDGHMSFMLQPCDSLMSFRLTKVEGWNVGGTFGDSSGRLGIAECHWDATGKPPREPKWLHVLAACLGSTP